MNTVNYYMSYLFLYGVLEINYMIAHIAGFLISFMISFFLNAYFTFQVKPTLAKFLQFPVTQLFNITVSIFFMYMFVENFHMDRTIAPVLSIFITIPFTFMMMGKILKR